MSHRRPWLRRLRQWAFYAFLAVVAYLLVRYARSVDWAEVWKALAAYDTATLCAAVALTLVSYLLYSCFDLGARHYAHHALPTPRVMAISAVSYAFSLNLGAVVGGAGFRYRLYSHAGLGIGTIGRIVAFTVSTNWVGYLALAGALFVAGQVKAPPQWGLSGHGLPWIGAAMLVAVVVYGVACHRMHGRMFHVRGHHFRLPSLPLAALQLVLAASNWALMGWLVYVLMPAHVGYGAVLGTLLLAAVASAMAHIPAGIGVLEAVFIAMLGYRIDEPTLLAGLLAYRACYYLGPLLLAIGGYAVLEAVARRNPAPARGSVA
ncbi:lysylphosphatidylglycerol synthase domain-containing protein [Lysobacter sp. LF1]|uniref:Lysylphosphatidylglycerol synthase domain-containing protein n=1 Tax=Lysobacter stagni TaxID=3045172 RepID=A0ABT6XCV9_9GAMM|nr:lysylphosphatidylglycerol synthase domain-containing protein [Lysobacter sp. LF1]MDI9237972.1 lysylphosphatidylglycerol synthase domain-containing protein [Lysobacter sp. LF1]